MMDSRLCGYYNNVYGKDLSPFRVLELWLNYLSSQQMYDLEGVFHNTHSHKLFSVISSVHHERINQP